MLEALDVLGSRPTGSHERSTSGARRGITTRTVAGRRCQGLAEVVGRGSIDHAIADGRRVHRASGLLRPSDLRAAEVPARGGRTRRVRPRATGRAPGEACPRDTLWRIPGRTGLDGLHGGGGLDDVSLRRKSKLSRIRTHPLGPYASPFQTGRTTSSTRIVSF